MKGRVSVETRDIELESYETDDFDLNGDLAIIERLNRGVSAKRDIDQR